MQIGCCWFDAIRHELLNQPLSSSWQMAPHESEVLRQLVLYRGQVVSIQFLLQAIGANKHTESCLSEAIQKIRFFLGPEHASLIETVAGQGYLLHSKPVSSRNSLRDAPRRIMPFGRYILLTLVTLSLIGFMYSRVGNADFFQPHYQQSLTTRSGEKLELHWYATPKQQVVLEGPVRHFADALRSCERPSWDSVSLSLSTDWKIISILLQRGSADNVELKNIKVLPQAQGLNFVDESWLNKVGICG